MGIRTVTPNKLFGTLAAGAAVGAIMASSPALASEAEVLEAIESLKSQVKAQSERIIQLENRGGSSSSADNSDEIIEYVEEHETNSHASKLKVGGWVDMLYTDNDKDGNNQYLDPHHLYIYFDARLDDNWRVYAELEFEHLFQQKGAGGDGQLKTERMYIEYNHDDLLNARIGKFNTPLGIWTAAHWAVSVPSIQKPIHEDNQYVANKQVGVEAFGDFSFSSDSKWSPEINYSVWTSQGDEVFSTNKPEDDKFAYGANVSALFDEKVKLGLTAYTQNDGGEGVNRREDTLHPYVELYLPNNITLTGEYQHQARNNSTDADLDLWYASAKWQFNPKAYAYYRRDQGDDEKRGGGDNIERNVFTLGYWPKPYVRTKLEFVTHEFDDASKEDFDQWGAWIGIAF